MSLCARAFTRFIKSSAKYAAAPAAFWALLALLFAAPRASAAEEHNSLLGFITPESWRAHLYEMRNWGQLDVLANTVFFGLLVVLSLCWLARRLRQTPETRSQTAVEWIVEGLNNMFKPILSANGEKYAPFVNAYFALILGWNLAGLIPGFQSPTAELNTTLALAAVSLTAVQLIAVKELGIGGYVKHLCAIEGSVWMLPFMLFMFVIELITQVSRVVSLSLRLFANIFAKETLLIVLYGLSVELFYIPIQLPVLLFGVLASLVQAFIFAILTAVYIGQFVEHAGHHHHEHPESHLGEAAAARH